MPCATACYSAAEMKTLALDQQLQELMNSLMTYAEAGTLLNVSARSVGNFIARGDLPVVRLGTRCARLRRADVVAFARRRTPSIYSIGKNTQAQDKSAFAGRRTVKAS